MRFFVSFLLLLLIPGTSLAADSSADIDRAVWIANAAYHIRQEHRWEYVNYLNHTLDQQGQQTPTVSIWVHEADALKQKRLIDSLDKSGLSHGTVGSNGTFLDPEVARANKFYEALKQAGPPGYLVGDYLQSELRSSAEPQELLLLGQENRAASEQFQHDSGRLLTVLGSVYDTATSNSSYADFINTIFGRQFGASIGEPAKGILDDNPDFATNKYVRQLVDSPASSDARKSQLLSDFESDLKSEVDDLKKTTKRQFPF